MPIYLNHNLYEDESIESTYLGTYERIIYLSFTRLDLAYVVSILTHFMHPPNVHHIQISDQVLGYSKGTTNLGFLFKRRRIFSSNL